MYQIQFYKLMIYKQCKNIFTMRYIKMNTQGKTYAFDCHGKNGTRIMYVHDILHCNIIQLMRLKLIDMHVHVSLCELI